MLQVQRKMCVFAGRRPDLSMTQTVKSSGRDSGRGDFDRFNPAIPVPSKAMATATRALQYRRTRRLATVAGMVPSLGFDLADTPGFRVVASQDRPFGRLGQRQIALRVEQETGRDTASRR